MQGPQKPPLAEQQHKAHATATSLPPSPHVRQTQTMDERKFEGEQSLSSDNVYVSLTYDPLDATAAMGRVKSPKAGAVVLFAG